MRDKVIQKKGEIGDKKEGKGKSNKRTGKRSKEST